MVSLPLTQADWSEGFKKKKAAGVQDMTLLSTITNDAINDNLKQRFQNQEIYVKASRTFTGASMLKRRRHTSLMCLSPSIHFEVQHNHCQEDPAHCL